MKELAKNVAKKISDQGYVAWFAGGCVRDQLLGIDPKDYDIATDATPDQMLEIFPKAKTVGAHFGVVLVKEHGVDFEIATFREDGEYQDGRRPDEVVFSSPEKDATRRDFSINGLFQDPITDKIIDYVDGKTDLKNKIINAIGDAEERFKEDHLRMLRAIRFATRLDFVISEDTWKAICRNAEALSTISTERIRDEFNLILAGPNLLRGFDLLMESKLMKHIIPEMYELIDCEQPPEYHPEGDVHQHVRLMISLIENKVSVPLVLSILLHDIAKPKTQEWSESKNRFTFKAHAHEGEKMTREILLRLKYPNQTIDQVSIAVANHMKFMDVTKIRESKLRRFLGRPHFDQEQELHRLDCLASHGGLDNYNFIQETLDRYRDEPVMPVPYLTGKDLISIGHQPGKSFSEILTKAMDLQLENSIHSKEEAVAWVKSEYPIS